MKQKLIFPVILVSLFIFTGCIEGQNLFVQSLKKTAPKSQLRELGHSSAPVQTFEIEPYGMVLLTESGMPLYTYQKDSVGKSNCLDECAIVWPPLIVKFESDVSGVYGVIQRDQDTLQVTLNGMPLYTYTPDLPYKVTGEGKNGEWSVVVFETETKN
jgi:predicted lipoprotein with Yx(FWY)xxD motif